MLILIVPSSPGVNRLYYNKFRLSTPYVKKKKQKKNNVMIIILIVIIYKHVQKKGL